MAVRPSGLRAMRCPGAGVRRPPVAQRHLARTPYLPAWGQTHPLPIRCVPVQRDTLADELPDYLDRREAEDAFIVRVLDEDPGVPGILEANDGATIWGRGGLLDLARTILLIEVGARAQMLAAGIGGSKNYGPGVPAQQRTAMGRADSPRAQERIAALDAVAD